MSSSLLLNISKGGEEKKSDESRSSSSSARSTTKRAPVRSFSSKNRSTNKQKSRSSAASDGRFVSNAPPISARAFAATATTSSTTTSPPPVTSTSSSRSIPLPSPPLSSATAEIDANDEEIMSLLHPLLPLTLAEVYGIERLRSIQCAALKLLQGSELAHGGVVIEGATGSGKTLAYVLPILQRMLEVAEVRKAPNDATRRHGRLARDAGAYALLLVPTKELAQQVFSVIESLTHKRLPWVTPVLLCGGRKRKAEKVALRKGAHVIIATPGRLLDHLQQTSTLDVAPNSFYMLSTLEFIVLDECDRLLGAQQEEVVRAVDLVCARRRLATPGAFERGDPAKFVFVSATAEGEGGGSGHSSGALTSVQGGLMALVQRLARDKRLVNVRATELESTHTTLTPTPSVPTTIEHCYALVPSKMRLTSLLAVVREHLMGEGKETMKKTKKNATATTIAITTATITTATTTTTATTATKQEDELSNITTSRKVMIFVATIRCVEFFDAIFQQFLLPMVGGSDVRISCLHGDMPFDERRTNASRFDAAERGVLICTDVAARGLDFSNVTLVIQFDAPTEADEYVHRAGRTGRMYRQGKSLLFLRPEEQGFIELLTTSNYDNKAVVMKQINIDYACRSIPFDKSVAHSIDPDRALQIACEQAVESDQRLAAMAKSAFNAAARSYATHSRTQRKYFNLSTLHLGHLAASFALRAAPSTLGASDSKKSKKKSLKRANDDDNFTGHGNVSGRDNEQHGGGMKKPRRKLHAEINVADEFAAH